MDVRNTVAVLITCLVTAAPVTADSQVVSTTLPATRATAGKTDPAKGPVLEIVAVNWSAALSGNTVDSTLPAQPTTNQNIPAAEPTPARNPAAADSAPAAGELPELPAAEVQPTQAVSSHSKQTARPAPSGSELVTLSFSGQTGSRLPANVQVPQPPAAVTRGTVTPAAPPAAAPAMTPAVATTDAQAAFADRPTPQPSQDAAVLTHTAAEHQVRAARPVSTVFVSPAAVDTPAARQIPQISFRSVPPLPKSVFLAPAVATQNTATNSRPGESKATTAPAFAVEAIAAVNWNLDSGLPVTVAKPRIPTMFRATACPFLALNSQLAGNESSGLVAGLTQVGPLAPAERPVAAVSFRNAPDRIPGDVFQELKQLVPEAATPTTASETYLADLHELVNGQHLPWVQVQNSMMVDLAPGELEPAPASATYVGELQSLVSSTQTADRTASSLPRPLQYSASAAPAGQQRDYDDAGPRPADGIIAPPAGNNTFKAPLQAEPAGPPGTQQLQGLFSPVGRISVNGISTNAPDSAAAKLPQDQAIAYAELTYPHFYSTSPDFAPRRLSRNTYPFAHNPLYFEDPNLERCGQSHGCLTTLASAVHFYSTIAMVPYLATVHHPRDCVRALPDCPTCHEFGSDAYVPEWSWKAAAVQAGAVAGMFYIVP